MIDWLQLNFVALLNVIVIDVVLAGDNRHHRRPCRLARGAGAALARDLLGRMVGAVVLRIAFAGVHRPAPRNLRPHAGRRPAPSVGSAGRCTGS
jgi:hypothetical protein